MSVAIGNFLVCLREEAGASQKDICEGICKVSTYSNYERDERVPDFLTLNRIFERLGYGIVSLSAYVTEKESAYLQWRMDTAEALRDEKYDSLAGLLNQEPQKCISLHQDIRKQYLLYLKGVLAEATEKNCFQALIYYEDALRLTCPFLLDEEAPTARVGKLELGIYAVYLRLLAQLYPIKRYESAKKLKKWMDYVRKQFWDEEAQVQIYPHLACIWTHLSVSSVSPEESLQVLENAYQLLKKQKKLYHVTEVLRLMIACKEEKEDESHSEQKDYRAVCLLYEFFEKSIAFHPYEICETTWMLTMVGDYLSRYRNRKQISQEDMSDGICAVESYSRIENSKRFPSRKNYKALTERLEIEPRYFTEIISTGSYRAIVLRREISKVLYQEEFRKGLELLKALEQ